MILPDVREKLNDVEQVKTESEQFEDEFKEYRKALGNQDEVKRTKSFLTPHLQTLQARF